MEHTSTRTNWYAVQCKGGESFRAAENLENQEFEVSHPTILLCKKRQGRLQWIVLSGSDELPGTDYRIRHGPGARGDYPRREWLAG